MFKRGQVFEGNIPESIHTDVTPRPGFFLTGKHKLVMLHDWDAPGIDSRIAIVAPITSAKAEVNRAQREGRNILESYVPLLASEHHFLKHDSYISTSQIMPVNREWLYSDPIGSLEKVKVWELSYILISNLGLFEVVQDLAFQELTKQLSFYEAASGIETK